MKLVQKPDLKAKLQIEKNVCLSGFFQKIFSGIYLHDNYWINDKKIRSVYIYILWTQALVVL